MGKSTSPFFSNRFKDSEFHITFNILHIIFIAILENLQNLSGQKIITSLVDLSFFSVLLTLFHNCSFYPIISFCAFVYEIIETLSWSYIKSGINFQVLSALEFIYALNVMPENVMRIFYWSIIIFGFTNIDFIRFNFRYTFYEFCMFVMLLMILFYPFSVDKYSNLYPFRINGLMSKKVFDKIVLSFTSKRQSSFENSVHKNLILIEVESFETKCLGRFNKYYPRSMPFLSNLSDNILHFSKIPSQPYTTWSAAGMFVVHCGFPLIVNNVDWSVRGSENFDLWKKLPCISDYLESLGYNQKAFCTGSCDIMNMKGFIQDHHYQTFDMAEHGIDRDSVLFNHIENDILPDLVKTAKDEKKPFSLFILTADTHPEFWVDDKFCSDLTDENFKPENYKGENNGSKWNEPSDDEDDDKMLLKKKKDEDGSEVDLDDKKKKKSSSDDGDAESEKKKKSDKNDDDQSSKKKKEKVDDDSDDKKKKSEKENDGESESKKNKKKNGDDESENSKEKKKRSSDDDESENSEKKKKKSSDEGSDSKKKKNEDDESENSEKKKKKSSDDDESDSKKKKNGDDESENSEKKKKKSDTTEDKNDESTTNKKIDEDDDNFENGFNGHFGHMSEDRSSDPLPKLFRCFTCFDRILKKFYNKVQSMGLNASNTVFAVYGDHLTMGERTYYYGEDRTLSLIFPLVTKKYLVRQYGKTKKEIEKKKITYYDVAPTILDMLNVQFSPPFPFGNSAFADEQNDPPSVDDFKFIYNYLTGDIEYTNVKCLNSDGFCTGNEY